MKDIKLQELCYALAQEYSPVLVTCASDYQQSDNYYVLLREIFKTAVERETGKKEKINLWLVT